MRVNYVNTKFEDITNKCKKLEILMSIIYVTKNDYNQAPCFVQEI